MPVNGKCPSPRFNFLFLFVTFLLLFLLLFLFFLLLFFPFSFCVFFLFFSPLFLFLFLSLYSFHLSFPRVLYRRTAAFFTESGNLDLFLFVTVENACYTLFPSHGVTGEF